MKNKVYEKIKRQNGETMANCLRDNVPFALEENRVVRILRHAGECDDAFRNEALPVLRDMLCDDSEPDETDRTVDDLLDEAGYNYEVTTTKKAFDAYKRYFASDELLCSFRSTQDRLNNYHCVWLVKKDVETIKRSAKPSRQDDYGTSVVCIQIAKSGRGYISIKNRYNHKVSNCDNTFGSNPDNIISGLSSALEKMLGCKINNKGKSNMSSFVLVDNAIVRELREIGGVVFGKNCFVKNGTLYEADPSHEIIFDNFVYSSKEKRVWSPVDTYVDGFIAMANDAIKAGNFIIERKQCA